ncbi:2135_t:CDS:2, partial [Cetraspora pellucida]
EISQYIEARWVSLSEACWRIFGFPMSDMNPSVIRLPCHLPNHHMVNFFEYINITKILSDKNSKKTMLTEYFHLNTTDPEARKYTYPKIPHYYVWNIQNKQWTRQKKEIWNQNFNAMSEDFIKNGIPEGQLCINAVLEHINHFLQQHDKNIDHYDLPKITNLVNEELPSVT